MSYEDTMDELADLAIENNELKKRIEKLESVFRHYHSGFGGDECNECGLDIRDPIHIRGAREDK